ISYAITDRSGSATASYSYRLLRNFGAGSDYATHLTNIRRPAVVLVGDNDEQLFAEQLAPVLQHLGLHIPVTLVPNMKHGDMIAAPDALHAIVSEVVSQE